MSNNQDNKPIPTIELISLLKQNDVTQVEAATILAGGLARGSHVISFNDGIVYDTGIDDEEVEMTELEFAEAYKGFWWIIDDVLRDEV